MDESTTRLVVGNGAGINLVSLMAKNAALKVDNEKMIITAYTDATKTVTVTRGAYGSRAAAHAAGTPLWRSNNSLPNQVRLPLGTSDGHTYLFTWDGFWTDSYIKTGMSAHKTFQFTSGGDAIWLEARTRFDGGTRAYETAGLFDLNDDVSAVDLRSYNYPGGDANWSLTDGDHLGPGVTREQPLEPRTASRTFVIKPNRWTRFWLRINQRSNDYDLIDFWVADEQVGPVKLYERLAVSVRTNRDPNRIAKFWLEYNASDDKFVRGDERPLVAYFRNFVALQDPQSVESLLVRPNDVTSRVPGAPRNVRIVN
jgi:hypothetical protein